MDIIIRADASALIGSGHIMRCLTVAHNLRNRGHRVFFYSLNLDGNLNDVIKEHGFDCVDRWFAVDIIIFDHYKIDREFESSVRKYAKKIVVIDDLANRNHDCDLLIDSNIMSGYESRYDKYLPDNTEKLLGVKYLIMRDEFIEARRQRPNRNRKVSRLLVFMGGADPTNETLKVLDALNDFSFKKVHIVCGDGNKDIDQIKKICLQKGYEYHQQITYMAKLMNEVDFSIGAGGLTTWERCYVGLPSSSTIVADNQKEGTEIIAELGAVINLGEHEKVNAKTYENLLKNIIEQSFDIQKISEKGLELTNSYGNPNPWVDKILEMKV